VPYSKPGGKLSWGNLSGRKVSEGKVSRVLHSVLQSVLHSAYIWLVSIVNDIKIIRFTS